MRKLFIGIGLLITLIVAAILILPSLIPASTYKKTIEQQISAKLGRNVTIAGDVKLSVFPSLSANAQDVTIDNGDDFSASPFISMDSLQANVKLLPLLKKQVEITKFTLVRPKISLEKLKNGNVNWVFGAKSTTAKATTNSDSFLRDGRYTDLQISLGVFNLKDGDIKFTDAISGKNHTLASVNVKMSMLGMDKPFKLEGNLVFDNIPIVLDTRLETPKSFLNAQASPFFIKLKSGLITLNADGKFTPSKQLAFDVNFDADIPSISKLDTALGIQNPYGALSEKVKLKAKLSFDGKNMDAKNAVLSLSSNMISTEFEGDFVAGAKPSASGDLAIKINDLFNLQKTLGFNYPQSSVVNSLDLSTSLTTNGTITQGKNVVFILKGDKINADYKGNAQFDNALSLDGDFNMSSPSFSDLTSKLGLKPFKGGESIGDFNVSGRASGLIDQLNLTNIDFKTKGDQFNASYQGNIKLGNVITLNGNFDAFIPSVNTLATQTGITFPLASALGTLNTSGQISGTPEALALTGLSTKLSDGILNFQFEGQVQTGQSLNYDGQLSANITSIRELTALTGTKLAESTKQGEIYGPFALSGQTKGTAENIQFTNANLRLDDIIGTGSFGANLATTKPMISGTLDLQGLDIRPYTVAQNPSEKIQPWSEKPLNLAILNLLDADLNLNTPNILVGRMSMGQSNIKTQIKNGVLTTSIPNVSLYGGQGDLDMTVNAKQPVATVALDFTLKDIDGQGFLGAAAGFTKLTGNTGTTMKFRGSGRSQADIMRSLSGDGNFELAEGIISGVDIGQFVGGLDSALKSGALPAGIGSGYTTPFNKLAGLFTVNKGVLTVGDFSLNSETVRADGSGTLDIGQQKIDFSLQPKLINATGLAGFGIPIKFTGNFGSVSAGLDTALLGNIIAAKAKAQLQSQITNKIGGDVGGILGSVLGGASTDTGSQPQSTQGSEDILGDVLGGLLGTPEPQQPAENTGQEELKKEEEKKEEVDPLEKALQDLFGGN